MKKYILFFTLTAWVLVTGFLPAPAQAAGDNVLIVFDASQSMLEMFAGVSRVNAAKKSVTDFLAGANPKLNIGLRGYGTNSYPGDKTKACADTTLLQTFTTDHASIGTKANAIQAVGTYTPTAYTLTQAAKDFPVDANNTLILLTDGKETCGGDPAAAAKALLDAGIKVTTHVVGIGVDAATAAELKSIAAAGGGDYYGATDSATLGQSLGTILTEVETGIDKTNTDATDLGTRVRGGNGFETAVPLTFGTYQLDHHQRPDEYDYFKLPVTVNQTFIVRTQNSAARITYNKNTGVFSESATNSGHRSGIAVHLPDRQKADITITAVDQLAIKEAMFSVSGDKITYGNQLTKTNKTGKIDYVYLLVGNVSSQHKDTIITIDGVAMAHDPGTPVAPGSGVPTSPTTDTDPAQQTLAKTFSWKLWLGLGAILALILLAIIIMLARRKKPAAPLSGPTGLPPQV